jgi:ParB family transcriptional regulator, chromosome partitioning protein
VSTATDVTASAQEAPVTEAAESGPVPGGDEQQAVQEFTERPMIPVALLTAHPGNVRDDKQADRQFCQSVAAAGIITPLEITTSPDHDGYIVVDGNIRLDAAIKVGLDAVPYVFSPGTADDAGQQFLHMLISSRFRRDLNVHEEAAALFSASEAGMTRADIRRATGLKAAEVRAGVAAGRLSPGTRELTEAADYEWTLEDLALLAPFEGDPDAMNRIMREVGYGQPLAYVVQKLTDERERRARRDKLVAELEEQGVTVLDEPPAGAVSVTMLRADSAPAGDDAGQDGGSQGEDADGAGQDQEMDPAAHASCPGAVAVLRSWREEPSWYCLDPARYGHASKWQLRTLPAPADDPGSGSDAGSPGDSPAPDPGRKLVIEGNKAWVAAGTVRQRWLAEFLSRKSPPSGTGALVAQFVTTQIITMPQPLRQALGHIRDHEMYRTLGGPGADAAASAAQPRLWMLALAPIAAAYEDQMTGTGEQRSTWRTDRYAPCPRADSGAWLRFLARAGYPLSPIEHAVADGVPYRGDIPSDDTADGDGDAGAAEEAAEEVSQPAETATPGEALGDPGSEAEQPAAQAA